MTGTAGLRADARRNHDGIRRAAVEVFRVRGLATSLEEVARAAGVSKGTIYHRFGGRPGLIDAVVDELVGDRIAAIIAEVEALDDPLRRFETYLRRIWLLQFDEPAINDVLLQLMPESQTSTAHCSDARGFAERLLADAQAAGAVRADLTGEDLDLLIWERGVIARACDRQSRDGYERRLGYALRGLMSCPA
jgi:AcrR family transcriptional regulator